MADDTSTVETETGSATETETTGPDLTGAQNPDAVKAAIKAERQKARDAEKSAGELRAKLKEYEDRDLSEQEKTQKRLSDAESRAQGAEVKALRLEVAYEKNLPRKLAARLQGSTKQELERDADELLADLTPANQSEDWGGGARGGTSTSQTGGFDGLIRRAAGR